MKKIVVGVDGSSGSAHALRWAAGHARGRDAVLHVVTAAPRPEMVGLPGAMYSVEASEDVERRATSMQIRVVEEVLGAEPDVDVRTEVIPGPAAPALLEAADGADLLVVGSRGLGGFRGLLLGSVSLQVVTHAPCPVVVVPSADPDRDG